MIYTKYDIDEPIEVGDLISITDEGTVKRSFNDFNKRPDIKIIGICTNVLNEEEIEVTGSGIVDINIVGMTGIGCLITASEVPGKGRVLKYYQEQRMFNIRSIGKVIQVYNDLNKVKILLNIE